MDYDTVIRERAKTLRRYGQFALRHEIFEHCGGFYLVGYQPNHAPALGVEVGQERGINGNFAEYSRRALPMIEMYYKELDYRLADWAHPSNLLAALGMASGGLAMVIEPLMDQCTGSRDQALAVAEAVFAVWRDGFGAVATSVVKLDEAEIDEASDQLVRDLYAAARAARCRVPIIFA